MATLGRSPGAAPLTSADIPDDSITGAKIVDDAIDSEHYAAGSVDAAHVAADVATQAEIDLKAPITNAALVTPNLGTPSAGTMTNVTGIPAAGVTGVLPVGVTGGSGLTLGGPAGMIATFGMAAIPTGWLLCDGAAISRTTYSALFTAIATTWGVGDGSSTFNVPDLEGAFLRGAGTSTLFTQDSTPTLAGVQSDQAQEHTHGLKMSRSGPHDTSHVGGVNWGGGSWDGTVYAADFTAAWPYVGNEGMSVYGSGGTSRLGDETRPNNIGVRIYIKY